MNEEGGRVDRRLMLTPHPQTAAQPDAGQPPSPYQAGDNEQYAHWYINTDTNIDTITGTNTDTNSVTNTDTNTG